MQQGKRTRAGVMGALAAALSITMMLSFVSVAGASSSKSGLTKAKAATAKALKPPTKIGIRTSLKSKPPTGKTIVWIRCTLPTCTEIANGMSAAAKAVGWTLKTITYQASDPSTMVAAMQQALQYNPVAVSLSGLPYATWSSEVPAYKKAGVMIIPQYIGPGVPVNKTTPLQIGGAGDVAAYGKIIGNYFVSASNGKGRALLVGVPSYPVLTAFTKAFRATSKARCPSCSITGLTLTIPQVASGQVNSSIVSALQKNPTINYVVTCNGVFVNGLPAALQAAGLSNKVKIIGESASKEQRKDLVDGQVSAFTGLATMYGGWVAVDAALRRVEGMKITPVGGKGGLPKQLLTKATVGTPTPPFNKPKTYPQQFKKLWKVNK